MNDPQRGAMAPTREAGRGNGAAANAPSAVAKIWVVHRDDNVGTVVGGDIERAGPVPLAGSARGTVEVSDAVPYGHKVALRALPAGEEIVKYGVAVGRLSRAVDAGCHVHVHNLESQRGRGDLAARP